MIRREYVKSPYDTEGINDMCETLNCIAYVYRVTGQRQKALQFFEQSLKRRVRIVSAALSNKEQVSMLLRTYEDVIALTKLEVKECSDKAEMLGKIGALLVEMGKVYDRRCVFVHVFLMNHFSKLEKIHCLRYILRGRSKMIECGCVSFFLSISATRIKICNSELDLSYFEKLGAAVFLQ